MGCPSEASMKFGRNSTTEKSGVFYPYYTVEHMQGRVKKATKKAIAQQVVEPHWDKLSPSQQESIRSLLEEIER